MALLAGGAAVKLHLHGCKLRGLSGPYGMSETTRNLSVSDDNASDDGIGPRGKLRINETLDEAGAPDKQNATCHRKIRFVMASVSLPNGG